MSQSQLRLLARQLRLGPKYVKVKKTLVRGVRRFTWHGQDVTCPCCQSAAKRFRPSGHCAFCDSQPRQRFLALYFQRRLAKGDAILHFAPEPCLRGFLCREVKGLRYVSSDLQSPHADVHVDLSHPQDAKKALGTGQYSVIIASHIMEHIPNDVAAMRLFAELLRPDGYCVLQVPMNRTPFTYEDWTITTPEGRLAAFGQEDHVRVYGSDFAQRLESVGFQVEKLDPTASYSPDEQRRFGLEQDTTYICRIPAAATS